MDNAISDEEEWYDALSDLPPDMNNTQFDQWGKYRHESVAQQTVMASYDTDVQPSKIAYEPLW